jgi:hypothetical protein
VRRLKAEHLVLKRSSFQAHYLSSGDPAERLELKQATAEEQPHAKLPNSPRLISVRSPGVLHNDCA